MRAVLILFGIIFSLFAEAQIIKGNVSFYPKGPFQVTHQESLARIEINGGFNFKLKGFINFEKDNINFAVGSTDKSDEVYMQLKFANKSRKMNTVIEDYKYMFYQFSMIDSRDVKINVGYYPAKLFGTEKGVFVLSSIQNKYMYFLSPNISEEEVIKIMERYK